MRHNRNTPHPMYPTRRRGAATLDYVLILGMAFTLGGICVYMGGRIIQFVHQYTHIVVGWPFL